MREIKAYITQYMNNYPLWKINDYIYSFFHDGEITETQCNNLIDWVYRHFE